MTEVQFWKISAAGNDFVLIDNRSSIIHGEVAVLSQKLCDRHTGIGADGVIFIQTLPGYDFEMCYFNADGSGPAMCGNGARSALFFVSGIDTAAREEYYFHAPDGDHYGQITSDRRVSLTIKEPSGWQIVKIGKQDAYLVDTGVPHLVIPVADVTKIDLKKSAPDLRKKFNVNVDYIALRNDNVCQIRTYERGVEDETLACGTGATAAAEVIHGVFQVAYPIRILARGGELQIMRQHNQLWLTGPTQKIFEGKINIEL